MTSNPSPVASSSTQTEGRARGAIRRHPVLAGAGLLIGVTWLAQLITLLAGWPTGPALILELAAFVAVPITLSAVIGGKPEVKRLLSGFLRVRIGFGRWLLVLLAMPALTVAVALVTGTYVPPPEGWAGHGDHLRRRGVTAPRAHRKHARGGRLVRLRPVPADDTSRPPRRVPGHRHPVQSHPPSARIRRSAVCAGTPWTDVALTWGVLIAVAPALRLLIGCLLIDTTGSLLAVGFLHAAFNASGRLSVVDGGWWQNVVAILVLTVLVGGWRLIRDRRPRPYATRQSSLTPNR